MVKTGWEVFNFEGEGTGRGEGTCICCADSYMPIYDYVGSDKDRLYVAVYSRGGRPRMLRHIRAAYPSTA